MESCSWGAYQLLLEVFHQQYHIASRSKSPQQFPALAKRVELSQPQRTNQKQLLAGHEVEIVTPWLVMHFHFLDSSTSFLFPKTLANMECMEEKHDKAQWKRYDIAFAKLSSPLILCLALRLCGSPWCGHCCIAPGSDVCAEMARARDNGSNHAMSKGYNVIHRHIHYIYVYYIHDTFMHIHRYRDQGPKTIGKGLGHSNPRLKSNQHPELAWSAHPVKHFGCILCTVNIQVKCMWTFMHQHAPGPPHTSLTTCRWSCDLWHHHFHASARFVVRNFAVDITSFLIIYNTYHIKVQ